MPKTANPWAATMSPKTENLESLVLTYNDAARLLAVCKRTVERMVKNGELPAIRVGSAPRISRAALMEFIERASVIATAKPEENGDGERGF